MRRQTINEQWWRRQLELRELRVSELEAALRGMLEDYRSDGCPHPACAICVRSDAAEAAAKKALGEARRP